MTDTNKAAIEKLAKILHAQGSDPHELAEIAVTAFQLDPMAYAKPNPAPTTDAVEKLAKTIYAAMSWACENNTGDLAPKWVEGGNSFAQVEARKQATAILAAIGKDVVSFIPPKPLVWGGFVCESIVGTYVISYPESGLTGKLDTNAFEVTLDGGQVVTCSTLELAQAAATAHRDDQLRGCWA